jgi:eukaryotic-like serine/threonine-protein kinase
LASLAAHDAHEPGEGAAMTLSAGVRLGPYEVVALLGSGGMGEVYEARDTRLDRDVAIKVLPAEFAADSERLTRFTREAKATAALSHPNILAVYDVGTFEGVPYLVEELLDGESLRRRLAQGAIPVPAAVEIAVQVARGLAAAHGKHIVHRDLKPENVFLTRDGTVKILDFGLAKLVEGAPDGEAETLTHAPTGATALGRVLGTVAYMAPEQARGLPVDHRADIFAFGVVLYEMLAGQRPFRGETATDTVAAILKEEPPPLPEDVPRALQAVVTRCLAKRPEQRFSSAQDLALALQAASSPGEVVSVGITGTRATFRTRRWRVLVGSALLLVALTGGVWFGLRSIPGLHVPGLSPTSAKLTDKDTIVLADFDNRTGDAIWDDALRQGLSVALEQSPFLSLLSDQRVNETLKFMGRLAGDRLTPAVTREVCERTSSTAMLAGSIAKLGGRYVIGLKAVACSAGDVLAEAQEQAADAKGVFTALDAAAVTIRGKLGESLGTVQKYATPLEQATTPSLEAWKAYSLGVKTFFTKTATASEPFFQRAADLDPNFAMAYARLADVSIYEMKRSAEYARKAYELREKVSERERLLIESTYYFYATGELEKAVEVYELRQQLYPRDAAPYAGKANTFGYLGHWDKALEECREALRLEPNSSINHLNLGQTYVILNRLDDAEAVYTQAEQRKLESEALFQSRYQLAFLKGDAARMAQWASAAVGKPGVEDLLIAEQANTEGWYGRLKNADELTQRAMESARHGDAKERAAAYQAVAALREVEAGHGEQARARVQAAWKLAPNRDVRAIAALALARAGETAGAETLAIDLGKSFPLDTLVQLYWLPTIRAAVALDRKDPNRAIDLLKAASPIELGFITQFTIFLCPVYVRGEAYLLLHDGQRAAAEFQKFIDHRGLVVNFPWGALARLGLARAYALQGDTAKARAVYQEFLKIWKDADPDLPVLKAAKAEYARLQ